MVLFNTEEAAVIAAHLRYIDLLGLTDGSVYARARALHRMAKAITGPLTAATAADLFAWRKSLTISDDAVVHYVSHAKEFYRWLVAEGRREDNPAEALPVPKLRKRLPRPISDEDLAYAIATADERVRPWLILAAWCGLRAKEIALLKWECVMDTVEPPVLLVAAEATKGERKERIIPLHPFAAAELAALPGRRAGYVFRRRDGRAGANAPWRISGLANRHLHGCGSAATLHQLRHWFGTNTYRAKRDLRVVQELLGHESPNTTAGYAAFDRAEAIEAVNALPVPTALRPVVRKLQRRAELQARYSKPLCTTVRTLLVSIVRHPVTALARPMDRATAEGIFMTYPDDPYRPAQPRFTPADSGLPPTSLRRQSAQQPGYTQQYPPPPPPGYYGQQPQGWEQPPAAPPKKKRRVFMWIFFAIQVIFIIWIITGLASHGSGPTTAVQAAHQCANGGWQGLFKSQADCVKHYSVALNDAANTGKGLGVAIIVVFWVVVDFFLGAGYGIYRLASRR